MQISSADFSSQNVVDGGEGFLCCLKITRKNAGKLAKKLQISLQQEAATPPECSQVD
jgi:hypothetical protein